MAIPFDDRSMPKHPAPRMPARHAFGQSRAARRFFAAVLAVFAVAVLAWMLVSRLPGIEATEQPSVFPRVFWISSALLLLGSYLFSRALSFVRIERQTQFRRSLLAALAVGSLFIGVQSFGLWTLMPHSRTAQAAQAGVTVFVLMLAALHALHFVVAVLFLSFVTVRALADRYDHEYHWGVTVCAWFWHVLGIVWMAILLVFAIAAT